MDSIFLSVNQDIIDLKYLLDPFACPANFLDVFAHFVNAFCEVTDSEDIKRHRIWDAIADNKLFGTWTRVKAYIDEICGGNARLVISVPDDAWFLCGDGSTVDNIAKETWSVFGVNQQTVQLDMCGITLEGNSNIWQKGIFNIDVDNNHLTQSEIDILYKTLFPSTPIGMTINVGYMEGSQFTPYFTLGEC